MARNQLNGPVQGGTPVDRAARMGYQQLFLYLAIFLIGGIVLGLGLASGALAAEGGHMVVMGAATLCLCVFAAVFFAAALLKKRGQGGRKLSK